MTKTRSARKYPLQIMLDKPTDKIVTKLAREYKLTRSTMGQLMVEVAIKIAKTSDLTK